MKCPKCRAKIISGQRFCASCGANVENALPSIVLTITADEAAGGCQKFVEAPGIVSPLRLNLKPGMVDGTNLQINNASFYDVNGGVMTRPLNVTVRVGGRRRQSPGSAGQGVPRNRSGRKKWWIPVVVIFGIILLIGIINEIQNSSPRSSGGDTGIIDNSVTTPYASGSIIGKWTTEGDKQIEFFSDGTIVEEGYSGSYSITGDRLRIQHPGESTEAVAFSVNGDVLHITNDDGETGTLYRVIS